VKQNKHKLHHATDGRCIKAVHVDRRYTSGPDCSLQNPQLHRSNAPQYFQVVTSEDGGAICIDIRTARPRESERFPPSDVYLVVLPRNKAWAYDVRVEVEIPVLYDLHGTMKCPSWYFLSCALKSQLDEYHTYGWDMRVNDEFWKLSRS
jgi:hypothetical protein